MADRLSASQTIGVFAKTFPGPTLADVLQCVKKSGIERIQLNLASAGLPTLPEHLDEEICTAIANEIREKGLRVAAISGTFNMIDPDRVKRTENLRRLDVLASCLRHFDAHVITLCTGTRDLENMWRAHPDNQSQEAWADLVESMHEVARIADRHQVTMALEPEHANVVNTAEKARRLLDEIGSPWLKVVLDPANLFGPEDIPRMRAIIDEAFDLLGSDIALVHTKELAADGSTGDFTPGRGVMEFRHVFERYLKLTERVPIIMHGLPADEVREGRLYLVQQLRNALTPRRASSDGVTFHATLNGVNFRYFDIGDGLPFVFQHGLSGDATKISDLMTEKPDIRLLSFDARYHGETTPLGPATKIGFDQSADDLLALLNDLNVEKAIIGGLSMGAGIALNFAIRYPDRVLALILSRPAWLDEPLPENVRMFPEMATLIRALGPQEAKAAFERTITYSEVAAQSSDSATALLGMFDDPICESTVERFERIPRDCPSRHRSTWRAIRVPTLILANCQDPIHPDTIAEELASEIPEAELQWLTPKCIDIKAHEDDFNRYILSFLDRHFPNRSSDLYFD